MLPRMLPPSAIPHETLRALALLARTPDLHMTVLSRARAAGASLTDLAYLPERELAQLGLAPSACAWLAAPDEARLDKDLRCYERLGIRLLPWGAPPYPALLAQLPDAPVVLQARGNLDAFCRPSVAIVGSRRATPAGRATARRFARRLAQAGCTIVSGLARGIDAAAHHGALLGPGRTVAVCATGLDAVYPPENTALAEAIAAQGALLSEFPPETLPDPRNFPRRNRLISGLALGTLVVEAALRSGSLITARLAAEQSRTVFAVPGSIDSPLSQGCNHLIRSRDVTLVTCVEQILADLQILPDKQQLAAALKQAGMAPDAALAMDKDSEILLDALGFEPAGVDSLVDRTGLESAQIAAMLLILELDGRVEPQPGGRYRRLPERPLF
jgi:DNA processing protein